jgi:hypothetical protein
MRDIISMNPGVKPNPQFLTALFLGFLAVRAAATTYYVDINSPNPTPPYTSWGSASTDIQSAINETTNGDLVLVASGTYSTGYINADSAGNRIFVNQAVTVQSVNGPALTVIRGQPTSPAVRCADLVAGATLSGFTLTGGTGLFGGGGAYCESGSSIVSNCVVTGNSVIPYYGGGIYGGTVYNCTITANAGGGFGGGAYDSTLYNCTINGNTASGYGKNPGSGGGVVNCTCFNCILNGNSAGDSGGGADSSTLNNCLVTGNNSNGGPGGGALNGTLNNCTVSGNTAAYPWSGGGICLSAANNSIIYGNSPDDIDTLFSVNFCCASSLPNGPGNITANPDFVNGGYQLQYDSPCLGTGNTNYVTTATDLNGNPRIINGTIDMGAYEFLPQTITIITEPLSQTIPGGQSVSFSISAACQEPLVYQWQFDGTNIAGAVGTNLMLTDIQSTNAGTYDVIISNSQVTVTSTAASLIVIYPPPVITQEPTNLIISPGSNAAFFVNAASYYPLTFQWQFDGTNLSDGEQISGSTNSALTISGAQLANTGFYQVIVANDYGAVTSSIAVLNVGPTVRYVNLNNPTPASPYLSWITAATNIQTAINACIYGDQIVVTDGVYQSGGYTAPDGGLSSIVDTNAISLQSVNGPAATFICGSNLMRCVYLANGAMLSGFTLTNGLYRAFGGGVCCASTNIIVTNCLLINNMAGRGAGAYFGSLVNCGLMGNIGSLIGGGAYGSILNNCQVSGNIATNSGGGAALSTLNNCCLNNNSSYQGGGAYSSTVNNCTISNNVAMSFPRQLGNTPSGGGVFSCIVQNGLIVSNQSYPFRFSSGGGAFNSTLINCVIKGNSAGSGGGGAMGSLTNCIISGNGAGTGGGVYDANLQSCVLSNNWATNNGGGSAYFSTLANCTLSGNSATNFGGGAFQGTLNNCLLIDNSAMQGGGGASGNHSTGSEVTLNNCILQFNSSSMGGGTYVAYLKNCLVVSNSASSIGGGGQYAFFNNCTVVGNFSGGMGGGVSQASPINNCIIYNNTAVAGSPNTYYGYYNNCCMTADSTAAGMGNITNEVPLFVNAAAGDFHLQSNCPCINAGNNAYAPGSTDLDGNPRIQGGTIDIGAYEYQTPTSVISYAYLQQYGLPTDGSVDFADLDGSGFNVYQDWIAGLNPTNPASVLVIMPLAQTNNASGVTVTWQSVSGINYDLQRSTNLSLQPPFSTIQYNITGNAGTTSYTDSSATNCTLYFYRVGVQGP